MPEYNNQHFNVSIALPEPWQILSYETGGLEDGWRDLYQPYESEIPEKPGESLFLFTAQLLASNSAIKIDAGIELSIYRHLANHSVIDEIILQREKQRDYYRRNGINTTISSQDEWLIDDVPFTFVDAENVSKRSHSWYRFAVRQVDTTLSIYAKIAGHRDNAFIEAIDLFQKAQWKP